MKPIHIATSPLTNRIFAGHVLKCGTAWAANKQDVTGAACGAVCEHVMAKGGTVEVTLNGKPKFEITVRDVEAPGSQAVPSGHDEVMRDALRYRFLRAARTIPISEKAARDPAVYDEAIDRAMRNAAPEATP